MLEYDEFHDKIVTFSTFEYRKVLFSYYFQDIIRSLYIIFQLAAILTITDNIDYIINNRSGSYIFIVLLFIMCTQTYIIIINEMKYPLKCVGLLLLLGEASIPL